jgi:hypothetical protein
MQPNKAVSPRQGRGSFNERFCWDRKKAGAGGENLAKAVLSVATLLCFMLHGCAQIKTSPAPVEGSMIMGRVLINNIYRGRYGLLPIGLQAKSIQIEIHSEDSQRIARGSTDEEGYFFVPNLAPGDYYLRSVAFDVVSNARTDGMRFLVRFLKARIGAKTVTYLGTLLVEVSKEGEFHFKELHEAEKARQRLLKVMGGTGWEACEFVSAPASSVVPPAGQLPGVKKEKPDSYRSPPKLPR